MIPGRAFVVASKWAVAVLRFTRDLTVAVLLGMKLVQVGRLQAWSFMLGSRLAVAGSTMGSCGAWDLRASDEPCWCVGTGTVVMHVGSVGGRK